MLEGKALIEDTDMPVKMQIQAMSAASQALDIYDVLDCKSIAAHIKKEFDKRYGADGSVWLDQTSDASSLTLKELLFTSPWRPSTSSSSEAPLPPLPPLDLHLLVFGCLESSRNNRHETLKASAPIHRHLLLLYFVWLLFFLFLFWLSDVSGVLVD
ncbi:Dynein ATPase [Bertholletia excelsa]